VLSELESQNEDQVKGMGERVKMLKEVGRVFLVRWGGGLMGAAYGGDWEGDSGFVPAGGSDE
jgi:hypothetical protein